MNAPFFLALSLALGAGDDPYVRSRVDTGRVNDDSAHCLWWNKTELTFHQNDRGNPETTGETEFDATRAALSEWQGAFDACGSIQLKEGVRVADRNIILYRDRYCGDVAAESDSCWSELSCQNKHDCWDGNRGTIALTTTTYDTRSGEIIDADVEMNAASFVFTTVDSPRCTAGIYNQSCVATDVQNTITHELGHAFGLDHTTAPGSTMNDSAPAGEISKRTLDSGTRQFVCDVYPKGMPPRDCVIQPVAMELGEKSGCAVAGTGSVLGLLGAWVVVRIGRRRRDVRG